MKVKVLPRATEDLELIRTYIEKEDEAAATQVVDRLYRSLALIIARPEIGRPVKGKDVREWTVPGLPYVIPYRLRPDELIILRVYHTRCKRPKNWT